MIQWLAQTYGLFSTMELVKIPSIQLFFVLTFSILLKRMSNKNNS